jgi:hypothetical protein
MVQMKQNDAALAEQNGDILRAVELYEAAMDDLSEDALINLGVLYWQMTDYGFSTSLRLPPAAVERAGARAADVLDEAARRFPQSTAVLFWKKYIAWADLGDPLDPEYCRELLRQDPGYLEPAMYLFSTSQGREKEYEALTLLARCRQIGTVRASYVASVIESVQSQHSSTN